MIKHILTTRCYRGCPYCITRDLDVRQRLDWDRLNLVYEMQRDSEIMLTGGEPTLAEEWKTIAVVASFYFERVCITTANEALLSRDGHLFDAITFSLHGRAPLPADYGRLGTPVYASILADQLYPELPFELRRQGYSGLTINEEQRNGRPFELDEDLRQTMLELGLSLRINRRGKCLDERIILPDLTVVDSFRPFMGSV